MTDTNLDELGALCVAIKNGIKSCGAYREPAAIERDGAGERQRRWFANGEAAYLAMLMPTHE